MREIERVGFYLEVDDQGYFQRVTIPQLTAPWKNIADDVRDGYLEGFSGKVHSIYVRGSVAKGTAIIGFSDFDAFVVALGGSKDVDLSWIPAFELRMESSYTFTSVDVRCVNYYRFVVPHKLRFLKFLMKTQCLCVYGYDLTKDLPRFRPSLGIMYHVHRIERDFDRFLVLSSNVTTPEEMRTKCQWIMKRLVRAAGELLIEEEKKYSRDLYLCYEMFAKHYPQYREPMYQAMFWAVNPTANASELTDFILSFGKEFLEIVEVKTGSNGKRSNHGSYS